MSLMSRLGLLLLVQGQLLGLSHPPITPLEKLYT
jgi:hypothetical protein